MSLSQSFRAIVGQLSGADDDYEVYADDDGLAASAEQSPGVRPLAIVRPSRIEFKLVTPQDFEDAEHIAARLRAGSIVIVNLQSCGRDLSERLIDFCSGLTYALDGGLEYIGEKVVLLAPLNVGLSSQDSGEIHKRRFFNQF